MVLTSPFPEQRIPRVSLQRFILSNPWGVAKDTVSSIDAHTGETLRYGELIDAALKIAHVLRFEEHIKAGQVVAIWSPNHILYSV
ncbi:hypothetical protein BZG36_04581, partial [Bifiguratus adelaidae]